MKDIELLIKAEAALAKSTVLYQVIGMLGDSLPPECETKIRDLAIEHKDEFEKLNKRVVNHLK